MRIPDEVARVEGCTCGGTIYHRSSEPRCVLLDVDDAAAVQRAVDEAEARVQAWVDERNEGLRR